MKCIEFLAEHSRCKKGIPVARLFRHYFCEGDHKKCPLKRKRKEQQKAAYQPSTHSVLEGGI